MSNPWGVPSRGISSGDVLIRPERHPACGGREAHPGSCTERENLNGDGKGKGTSGSNREAESTDAPARGGLLRSVRWAAHESGGLPDATQDSVRGCSLGFGGSLYDQNGYLSFKAPVVQLPGETS